MANKLGASVVVVGGGFAGSGCAKALAKEGVHVTLVDQHNYHQFQPLLYQVATAQLSSSDIARPLRGMFRKDETVDVKMAEVTSVDPKTRTVTCADGSTFTGDYLVLAMGSRPELLPHPRRGGVRLPALLARRRRAAAVPGVRDVRGRRRPP